jgi:hypothetical protein
MALDDAHVFTSDGKDAGRVTGMEAGYFTSARKGIVENEEFRIPLKAIARIEPASGKDRVVVRLALSEDQLKHGYGFVKGRPNSPLVEGSSGSEPLIPSGKQTIRYEALEPALHGDAAGATAAEPPPAAAATAPPPARRYACDMCPSKFDDRASLQKHRSEAHGGPVGL